MRGLKGKNVLITGAASGIGRATALRFAEEGAQVGILDLDLEGALETVSQIEALGQGGSAEQADISDYDHVRSAVEVLEGQIGPFDILINNAGCALAGRHEQVPQDRWEKLLNLNLFAPLRITGQFLPKMLQRASGHIVNISSLAGWVGAPNLSVYVASKFGLRGFGESLAAEAAKKNVHVSNVYPSFSRTPILESDQFVMGKRIPIPDKLISDPADVVARMIKGIERNRLHIFPDNIALRAHYLKRFAPWAMPLFSRKMPIHD